MNRALIALTLIAGLAVALLGWRVMSARRTAVPVEGAAGESGGALPADYPRQAVPMPAFHLVDQTGAPFDTTRLAGKATILSFVFAHCATMCPELVETTRRAAERLGPERARLVWVTLDPERDTPDSLPAIAERWRLPSGGALLSGAPAEVGRLLDTLGVERSPDPASDQIAHPPLVYVLDARGRMTYVFNGPSVEWIVEGVRRAAAGS